MFIVAGHFLQCGSIDVLKHTMSISVPKLEVSDGPESLLTTACQQSSQQKVDAALQTNSGSSTSDDMGQLSNEPVQPGSDVQSESELTYVVAELGDTSSSPSCTVSAVSESQPAAMVTDAVPDEQVPGDVDGSNITASSAPSGTGSFTVKDAQNERAVVDQGDSLHHSEERSSPHDDVKTDEVREYEESVQNVDVDSVVKLSRDGDAVTGSTEFEHISDQLSTNDQTLTGADTGAPTQCSRPITSLLVGETQTFNLTQTEYYRISQILSEPEVDETKLEGFVGKILPYVLQRVKMRGCCVLQPSRISSLVRRQAAPVSVPKRSDPFGAKRTRGRAETKQYPCPVSRLDCLTCLLGTVDRIVARDLLLVMSQFPMALPLIMRNVAEEGKYSLMTPLLRGVVIKWEAGNGKIVEHSLFSDPFRLLVAVRLGENNIGKSAILNQLLAKENTFSTKGEPGSQYGKPATVDGSVEFVWLTQETCKDTLWKPFISQHYSEENIITLLANLHGDANENLDTIALLSDCFQASYLAFIMPNCSESQYRNFLIPSEDRVSTIRVDPVDYDIDECSDIQTSSMFEDATLHKVRSCLDDALKRCSVEQRVALNKQCSNVSLADGIETDLSQKIIDSVERDSCKSVKRCLRLQKPGLDEQSGKRHGSQQLVVNRFIRILQLPPVVMQRALIHLENELSRLCNAETQQERVNLSLLKADLVRATVNSHTNPNEIVSIRQKVADTLNIIDSMNFGLEHLFREVAHLYELHHHEFTNTMQKVAELFLNGHPIELLDGDAGQIQMLWLNAIFKHVCEMHPEIRVYVVSIIGLQSSGKSTLLNSLFACRFAVSVGRCSRGLFMRLLFLDEETAKKCNADAILLIDSEGLGSHEKMGDVEGEKKDRLLATFAMGISNLTII